jgi:hypothetical protein
MDHNDFDAWMKAADAEVCMAWQQMQGEGVPYPEPIDVSASDVIDAPIDEEDATVVRSRTLRLMMDFIWAEGPLPLKAFKRLIHITYNIAPARLYHMNQTQLARILNETRAAFSARDMRVWEEFLEDQGFFGTRHHGKKGNEARKRYAKDKKGNNSRKGGKRQARKFTKATQEIES